MTALQPSIAPTARRHVSFTASAIAIGAGIVWSAGAVLTRKAEGADAFQYLVWRSIGIIVVLEIVALARREQPMIKRAFTSGRLMMYANLGLLLASFGFVYAVKTTSAANAAFLASLTPVMAVFVARATIGERLNRLTIVVIATAVTGLLIMVIGDLGAGNMLGNLGALSSSLGFAIYAVCVRSDPSVDWAPVMPGYAVMMIAICGGITLAQGHSLVPPAGDIALAMFHGGVVIVVGTLMFNWASAHLPAVAMAVFAQSEMVFVPIWGVLFLDDSPRITTYIGGAIIFVAVLTKAVLDAPAQPVDHAPLQPSEVP